MASPNACPTNFSDVSITQSCDEFVYFADETCGEAIPSEKVFDNSKEVTHRMTSTRNMHTQRYAQDNKIKVPQTRDFLIC